MFTVCAANRSFTTASISSLPHTDVRAPLRDSHLQTGHGPRHKSILEVFEGSLLHTFMLLETLCLAPRHQFIVDLPLHRKTAPNSQALARRHSARRYTPTHSWPHRAENHHSCASSCQRAPSRGSQPAPEHQPQCASDPCRGAWPPPPCAPTVAHGVDDTETVASASAAQQKLQHDHP